MDGLELGVVEDESVDSWELEEEEWGDWVLE